MFIKCIWFGSLMHFTNYRQTIWIITASTAIFAMVSAKDDIWPQKNPLKFLKAVMEQPTMCESGDYDSCENSIFTNKGYVKGF